MKIIKEIEEFEDLSKVKCLLYNCLDKNDAYSFCKSIADAHYENFPVGSILIPKNRRKYFFAIYAFSRIIDDIADEFQNVSSNDKIIILDQMEKAIILLELQTDTNNPLLIALKHTIHDCKIDKKYLIKLIQAFKMDSNFIHPSSWEDLLNYCDYSANPVGALVLSIMGNLNPVNECLSDSICTGLQLVNFWQDLSVDILNNRYYIPKSILTKYSLDKNFEIEKNSINFTNCRNDIFARTYLYFVEGKGLLKNLDSLRLKLEISFVIEGGLRILRKTELLCEKIILQRPKLTKIDYFLISFKAIWNLKG